MIDEKTIAKHMSKKIDYDFEIVNINYSEKIVTLDLYDGDKLIKKNKFISFKRLSSSEVDVVLDLETVPKINWKMKDIKEWLSERELEYNKWFTTKYGLMKHVRNYIRTVSASKQRFKKKKYKANFYTKDNE